MKASLRRILSVALTFALLTQPLGTTAFADENAVLPAVTADSGAIPEQSVVTLTAFAPLPGEEALRLIPVGADWDDLEFPQSLAAFTQAGEEIRVEGVRWICEEFQQDCAVGDSFTVTPVLPTGFALVPGVLPPVIQLEMVASPISPMGLNDRVMVEGIVYKEINPTQAQLIGVAPNFAGGAVVVPETVPSKDGQPLTVVGIEAYAFQDAITLQEITTGPQVEYLGVQAFSGCKALSAVTITPSVRSIGDRAFENCTALTGITLPDTLTSMGAYVLDGSGVESLTIPAGLRAIKPMAFASPKLTTITLAEGMKELEEGVLSGHDSLKKVELPQGFVRLGNFALKNCYALTEIVIPDSVTHLGMGVFEGCSSLEEVRLPDSIVELGTGLFSNCSQLTNVRLPNTITRIPRSTFYECGNLVSVEIPDTVTSIDTYAFYHCGKLGSINLPPELTLIGSHAFDSCFGLNSLTLPNSVTIIGSNTFAFCNRLKSVTLSNQLDSIGSQAFYACGELESMVLPDSVTSLGNHAFAFCEALESITLSKRLTYIAASTFSGCAKLTAIHVPEGVTQIQDNAFSTCVQLQTVELPESLEQVHGSAFQSDSALTEITLPAKVMYLGREAFAGCTQLEKVTVKGTLTLVEKGAFGESNSIVTVPDLATATLVRDSGVPPERIKLADGSDHGLLPSIFTVGNATYTVTKNAVNGQNGEVGFTKWGGGGETLSIPETVVNSGITYRVTSLLDHALQGQIQLKQITLPNSVQTLGYAAFGDCTELSSINLPEGITQLPADLFRNCTALEAVRLPQTLESLSDNVFYNCASLQSIVLPDKVDMVGQSVFSHCSSLSSVTLSKGLSYLGYYMFSSCTALVSIEIPDNIMWFQDGAFQQCTALASITIPKNATELSHQMFFNCTALREVHLPDGLRRISSNAFEYCKALESITLPTQERLEVGQLAFAGCSALREITVPQNVYFVGMGAFSQCTALKKADIFGGISYSSWGDLFYNCVSLEEVTLGGTVSGVPDGLFQNSSRLKTVTLGMQVEIIGASSFAGTSLDQITLPESLTRLGAYAFAGTRLTQVTIPDDVTVIGDHAFDGCNDLGYASIGKGVQEIGLRAFPSTTQLISSDPRVQLLLVKYLSQEENKRPATTWDGTSSIAAGAVAAVDREITITGSVNLAAGAELTVWKPITVSGHWSIDGKVKLETGGAIILAEGGKITGPGAVGLPLHYAISLPALPGGSLTADQPYGAPGDVVTLTTQAEQGYRLQKNSITCNGMPVAQGSNGFVFVMPANIANISAVFESAYLTGVTIAVSGETTLASGESALLTASPVPDDTDIAPITYMWSADLPDAVTLTGADTAAVQVTAAVMRADTDVTLTVTATQGPVTQSVSQTLRVLRQTVQSITLTPEVLTLNPGLRERLTLTALPAGTSSDFTWQSSNPVAATVDENGVIHTLAAGETKLTAQADGVTSNEVILTVTDQILYATGVTLSTQTLAMEVGDTARITAELSPANATVRGVWSSSRPQILTVDAVGQLTAHAPGEATLTYAIPQSATEQLLKTVEVSVSVIPVASVRINESPAQTFRQGDTLRLTATVFPANAFDRSVTWSSSDPSVATVTPQGVVTFQGGGIVSITAASAANPAKFSVLRLVAVVDASGVLRLPGGQAAAYKKVELTKDGGAPMAAYTDGGGGFRFAALQAGDYTITSNPHTAGVGMLNQRLTVAPGGNPHWVLEYPKSEAGSVTVTFLDTAQQPVAGVCVSVQSESPYQYRVAYSDGMGRAHLEGLLYEEAGTAFSVNYSTGDGAFGNRTITLQTGAGAPSLSVELPAISTVHGRVEDLRGVGVSGVSVQVGHRAAYTGQDGSYAIRGQLDPGKYTVKLSAFSPYIAQREPEITVPVAGQSVEVPTLVVSNGISVSGRFLLDGRTDNYQKAYLTLHDEDGKFLAGSYTSGESGYVFESVIRQTGKYRLTVSNVYGSDGGGFLDYEAVPKEFTVSSMDLQKMVVQAEGKTILKTSELFSGDHNVLAADTEMVQSGGKFELHGKYRNNGSQTVTATFHTTLTGAVVDPSYAGTEYGQLTQIVTLKPGESGRFYTKALADKLARTVNAFTTVTVNGVSHDFAKLSIEVVNILLSVQTTNLGQGQSFLVYGESTSNSKVLLYEQGGGLLGSVQLSPTSGRWYSVELPGFDRVGPRTIFAMAEVGGEVAMSAPLTLQVSAAPLQVQRVTVDQLAYEDLPVNSRTGVRTFSHTVDNSLRPDPLDVRSSFTGGEQVSGVTYHFAGLHFPAQQDAAGRWHASFAGWRGTGSKPLTATVRQRDGGTTEFVIAQVVVLIDPSGWITDSDTGNPLPGASATCYVKNDDGSYSLWDSQRYAQPSNPSLTDSRGHYGWMVPDGTYQINLQKAGYESVESGAIAKYRDGIDVPPPALDVNFAMIPTTPMALIGVEAVSGGLRASFSRSVKSASVTVLDAGGQTLPTEVLVQGDSVVITGRFAGGEHTVNFRDVLPKSGTAPEYRLASATAKLHLTEEKPVEPERPTAPPTSSGGGGRGRSSDRFVFWPKPLTLTPAEVRAAPRDGVFALLDLTGTTQTISGKAFGVALAALQPGEQLILREIGQNNRTQVQFAVNPLTLTTLPEQLDFSVSLTQTRIKNLFERHFTNRVRVVTMGQQGAFGFSTDLAVDLDLAGMNPSSLRVYRYDAKTNQYFPLPSAQPAVDSHGFTHLKLTAGDTLIVTDAPLTKR